MTDQKSTKHVDLDNAREADQVEVMKQIIEDGGCPFCWENLQKYHDNPILKKGQYWIITPNKWPYKHTKYHFLLISLEHVEHLSELDPAAGTELIQLAQWLIKQYQIPGGGLVMRFGDTDYSAGSVTHLHAQLVQPDLDDPDYQPTRIKIGKNFEKLAK